MPRNLKHAFLLFLCVINFATSSVAEGIHQLIPELLFNRNVLKNEAAVKLENKCHADLMHTPNPVEIYAPTDKYRGNTNEEEKVYLSLNVDALASYRAALCYKITGEIRYAKNAQVILDAWASKLKTINSPQGIANINFSEPYFVISASLINDADGWDNLNFKNWLKYSILKYSSASRDSNIGNWGVLLEACIGIYLNDSEITNKSINRWKELLSTQISDDGHLPKEICRSNTSNWCDGPDKGINGISYTHFALLPMAVAAKIFEDDGHPLWNSESGKLLQNAFVTVAHWTRHPETFPFYFKNNGRLNGTLNASYFALLNRYYPNEDASSILSTLDLGMNDF